jgi:hypothetical protein
MKVSVVYPGRQYLPAKTRFFIDYTLAKLGPQVTGGVERPDAVLTHVPGFMPISSSGAAHAMPQAERSTH